MGFTKSQICSCPTSKQRGALHFCSGFRGFLGTHGFLESRWRSPLELEQKTRVQIMGTHGSKFLMWPLLIPIMDLHMNYIFWKFEAGKVHEYGVIWQPPFLASLAYKPQILIWIWFCTFNGYLKIFAIQPWRTDIKIMTSAFATSATSVSYTHMKGKDWYLRKNVNISILLHIKISIFWNFETNLS